MGPNIDLSTLFRQDLPAQEMGLQFLGQQRQGNNMELAKLKQQMELEALMAPLKRQEMQAGLDRSSAELPGIKAQSETRQQEADFGRKTFQTKIDEYTRGVEEKDRERTLKKLESAGRAYMQAEPILATIPPPARMAAAKEMLGKFWRPEFEQIPPDQLPRQLNFFGSDMMASQLKMMQATTVQGMKNETQERIADKKIASTRELEILKGSLREQLAKMKTAPLPTREKVLGQLMEAIQDEEDPGKRKILIEQYNEFAAQVNDEKVRVARAGQAGKIDPGAATGMETIPLPPAPGLPVPQGATPPGPGNNPATADPNLSKLPPGTKALGNGIYQLPDGRRVTANK